MQRIFNSFMMEGKKSTIVVVQTKNFDETKNVYIAIFDKKEAANQMQKFTGDTVRKYQDLEIKVEGSTISFGDTSFTATKIITEE